MEWSFLFQTGARLILSLVLLILTTHSRTAHPSVLLFDRFSFSTLHIELLKMLPIYIPEVRFPDVDWSSSRGW